MNHGSTRAALQDAAPRTNMEEGPAARICSAYKTLMDVLVRVASMVSTAMMVSSILLNK